MGFLLDTLKSELGDSILDAGSSSVSRGLRRGLSSAAGSILGGALAGGIGSAMAQQQLNEQIRQQQAAAQAATEAAMKAAQEAQQQAAPQQTQQQQGLYDPQLEKLIDLALGDGELTAKEKQVLLKKADALGVDRDELEMVLESRLANMKKAAQPAEAAQKSSKKAGEIKKCPACGAIIQSYMGACPECGYAFENVNANLTSKELADKLQKLTAEWDAKINNFMGFPWQRWDLRKGKEEALANTIRTTPIPNSKSDLFEFMTITQAACLSPATTYLQADAYMIKYKEAVLKAKTLFATDKLFANLFNAQAEVLSEYEKIHSKQEKIGIRPLYKVLLGLLIGFVSFIVLGLVLALSL